MDRKVTLIYSNSYADDCQLPENKYWRIIKHDDAAKIMPTDCYSDGDSPNMDIESISSDLYRGRFQDFSEYINDFIYISEASIEELIRTVKAADCRFLIFSFIDNFRRGTVMITIRVRSEPWQQIKVFIELSNVDFSLKTRRVKMCYSHQTLELLNYLDKTGFC